MALERVNVLGVGVDVLEPQDIESVVMGFLDKGKPCQIVFITIWDLLRARGKSDYARCVRDADLVIPVSKSIVSGAKFLKRRVPVRYNPFDATISIMSVLESHYRSAYFLGGKKKTLMIAERNVRTTFKGLQIVGRCSGYYKKSIESDIEQAIYKASPSIVLMSEGIRERDCWFYSRRNKFKKGIFMYYHDALGIFSDRIKPIKEKTFRRGHEIYHEVIRNPLKFFLIFPYILYKLRLVYWRLRKK